MTTYIKYYVVLAVSLLILSLTHLVKVRIVEERQSGSVSGSQQVSSRSSKPQEILKVPIGPLAIKAGGKSEKVNILGKRFFVFPELKGVKSDGKGDGIEYELTDIHGKVIIWKDLPRDWKDLKIEWVVICSPKYDLTYVVRDFN